MFEIFGSFLFRNEGNGFLTSVYLEHLGPQPFVESCIRIGTATGVDPFIGIFNTSWLEPQVRTATLTIGLNPGVVYNLEWTNISGSTGTYRGSAVLSEGQLIGNYWYIA